MATEKQQENRKLWIEALESGKYKQGEGNLCFQHDIDGTKKFCCLGVAAEIAGLTVVNTTLQGGLVYSFPYTLPNGESGVREDSAFPSAHWMMERFGIEFLDYATVMMEALADMNDDGIEFDQIAKALRRFFDAYDRGDINAIDELK